MIYNPGHVLGAHTPTLTTMRRTLHHPQSAELSRWLAESRDTLGLTRDELARVIPTHERTLYRWETMRLPIPVQITRRVRDLVALVEVTRSAERRDGRRRSTQAIARQVLAEDLIVDPRGPEIETPNAEE